MPAHAAIENEAPLTEWTLSTDELTPASSEHVRDHRPIVFPVTGFESPITRPISDLQSKVV